VCVTVLVYLDTFLFCSLFFIFYFYLYIFWASVNLFPYLELSIAQTPFLCPIMCCSTFLLLMPNLYVVSLFLCSVYKPCGMLVDVYPLCCALVHLICLSGVYYFFLILFAAAAFICTEPTSTILFSSPLSFLRDCPAFLWIFQDYYMLFSIYFILLSAIWFSISTSLRLISVLSNLIIYIISSVISIFNNCFPDVDYATMDLTYWVFIPLTSYSYLLCTLQLFFLFSWNYICSSRISYLYIY